MRRRVLRAGQWLNTVVSRLPRALTGASPANSANGLPRSAGPCADLPCSSLCTCGRGSGDYGNAGRKSAYSGRFRPILAAGPHPLGSPSHPPPPASIKGCGAWPAMMPCRYGLPGNLRGKPRLMRVPGHALAQPLFHAGCEVGIAARPYPCGLPGNPPANARFTRTLGMSSGMPASFRWAVPLCIVWQRDAVFTGQA